MSTIQEKITEYAKTATDKIKNGAGIDELNKLLSPDEVQAIMNHKLKVCGEQNANNDFHDTLSLLAEWFIKHLNTSGTYREETTKNLGKLGIESDRQFRRSVYDGQLRTNTKTGKKDRARASTTLFSDFLCSDSEGREFYSFEQYDAMQHNDTYFDNELYSNIVKQLTEQEKSVLDCKIQGLTQEQTAKVTDLSIKQVRGRLNKIRTKSKSVISDIA